MTVSATISLDSECWDHKPSSSLQYKKLTDKYGNPKSEVKVLGSRLGTDTSEITPKGLARAIVQGRTWSPFVFNECPDWKRRRRIEPLFKSCQVLGVDYDDGDGQEEIMGRAEELGVRFNLLHHSFSSTPEHPKYRGVVFLENEVTDLHQAKLYATALAHALGGDRSCVDVARLYFGSRSDSVVYINDAVTTSFEVLDRLVEVSSASQFLTNRTPEPKKYDPDWGTDDDQRLIFARLPSNKRQFVRRKIGGILLEIERFDGSNGSSRYECLWKNTSRIARMQETVGNVIHDWVLERVENNSYFDGWDKNPSEVIRNAIAWSFEHSDPPV
jgi:hypothetical protein